MDNLPEFMLKHRNYSIKRFTPEDAAILQTLYYSTKFELRDRGKQGKLREQWSQGEIFSKIYSSKQS